MKTMQKIRRTDNKAARFVFCIILRQPLKTPRRHLRCPFSAWTALSSPHVARLRFGSSALPEVKPKSLISSFTYVHTLGFAEGKVKVGQSKKLLANL
ncbi:MAG: hypothetical protein LBB91_09250, partial [Clostridiales bacterium]|nr:hypothetical protein [Clostridiales bacterium]